MKPECDSLNHSNKNPSATKAGVVASLTNTSGILGKSVNKRTKCDLFIQSDGFGGLVVSMLASGSQVRGLDFSDVKILSMPSFGGKVK
jgi:hypothetical protein